MPRADVRLLGEPSRSGVGRTDDVDVACNTHAIGTTGVAVWVGRQALVPAPHLFCITLKKIFLGK